MPEHPGIYVLAGTNGAGKSSVGGEVFTRNGGAYFNPDEVTQAILRVNPRMSLEQANGAAWQQGFELLKDSIARGFRYAFETTLGGTSITETLIAASQDGIRIYMWYCALATPELHMARVAARVQRGGHDIPERRIRERYDDSRRNLVTLLPHLEVLRLYDNSAESTRRPRPKLVLEMRQKRIAYADLRTTPGWAKPIVAAAHALDPGFRPGGKPRV
jgi:predicted ABC-type ATPase